MIGGFVQLLRPSPREIVTLAKREADPRYVAEFEPLHLGPIPSLLALCAIGMMGGFMAPFRAVARLRRSRR